MAYRLKYGLHLVVLGGECGDSSHEPESKRPGQTNCPDGEVERCMRRELTLCTVTEDCPFELVHFHGELRLSKTSRFYTKVTLLSTLSNNLFLLLEHLHVHGEMGPKSSGSRGHVPHPRRSQV